MPSKRFQVGKYVRNIFWTPTELPCQVRHIIGPPVGSVMLVWMSADGYNCVNTLNVASRQRQLGDRRRITGGGWRGSDVSSIVPPITRTQPAAHSWILAGIIGVMTEPLHFYSTACYRCNIEVGMRQLVI